ncbi:hypothetical protein CHS0354_037484 [Potamilus streckersoni]|uniref:Uncharacterized protein n=1 Tax=Potamilus streckersoni TaxID=2493646 RepID=A0AAE0RP46_9BIVA|nr:hypothetical protein CHS0354_037484 [Potamilus streckersoni]
MGIPVMVNPPARTTSKSVDTVFYDRKTVQKSSSYVFISCHLSSREQQFGLCQARHVRQTCNLSVRQGIIQIGEIRNAMSVNAEMPLHGVTGAIHVCIQLLLRGSIGDA